MLVLSRRCSWSPGVMSSDLRSRARFFCIIWGSLMSVKDTIIPRRALFSKLIKNNKVRAINFPPVQARMFMPEYLMSELTTIF